MQTAHTPDYVRMDLAALQRVYSHEMDRFKTTLLNDRPWPEVVQCRESVSALSSELHRRLSRPENNPSGNQQRSR